MQTKKQFKLWTFAIKEITWRRNETKARERENYFGRFIKGGNIDMNETCPRSESRQSASFPKGRVFGAVALHVKEAAFYRA
jgi:hypothetical protein